MSIASDVVGDVAPERVAVPAAALPISDGRRADRREAVPWLPRRGQTGRIGYRLTQAASVAACVGIWQLLASHHADFGVVTFRNVPSPIDVARAFVTVGRSASFATDLAASIVRVLAGFLAAAVVGISLGVLVGRSRRAEAVLLPTLELLRPVPAVAWIPLAVLMFPSAEASMMSITFVGALFPILVSTVQGVEGVDPRLVAAARSLGARRAAVLREVVVPAAAPAILAGLTIGMGTAWFCLVTAEMISGQYGIGYFTWESYTLQNYDSIVVGMILIGLLGTGGSLLVRRLGALLCPWTRLRDKA